MQLMKLIQNGILKGYRINFKKTEIEKHNFNKFDLMIEYTDNYIIISKQKELQNEE